MHFEYRADSKMSDRRLRSGTRKDYRQMIAGVDSDVEVSDKDGNDTENDHNSNNNYPNNKCTNDVRSEPEDSLDEKDLASEEDEVRRVEKRLLRLRMEKELRKKKKLKQLEREARNVERSLKQLKEGCDRADNVNIVALRKMPEVVDEVDKFMDKKFNLKTVARKSRSSKASSSDCSSASHSDHDSSSDSDDGKKKYRIKKRRSKKGKKEHHRSGKSKKITSYVKYPEKWPHTELGQHLILKEKKYDDLTMAEFCVGELSILESDEFSDKKRGKRLSHLKDVMYLATKYQWQHVLNFHASCLLEIERGVKKWGSNFDKLQSTTLAGGLLQQSHVSNGGERNIGSTRGQNGGPLYCKYFQRGTCNQRGDHMGQFNGESKCGIGK